MLFIFVVIWFTICVPVIKFNSLTILSTVLAITCTEEIEGICIYEQYSRINFAVFQKELRRQHLNWMFLYKIHDSQFCSI